MYGRRVVAMEDFAARLTGCSQDLNSICEGEFLHVNTCGLSIFAERRKLRLQITRAHGVQSASLLGFVANGLDSPSSCCGSSRRL
jgi:hypothetical protein